MNTSPELTTQIRDILCAQMPYGGGIISYDIGRTRDLANDTCTNGREDHQESPDWFGAVSEHLDE
jgi:hypothetical protein